MVIYEKFKIKPMGETAILIEVANEISREANSYVLALMNKLESMNLPGVIEYVPAYTTLLIHYDPQKTEFKTLAEACRKAELEIRREGVERIVGERRLVEIPVAYGGEFGPDLEFIANYAKLKAEDVVKIHSSQTYLVYMIGFTPGFTYMGEVPDIIAAPRLKKPRLRVPAGSVGIAGKQTGIYPIESPGGWRIIGRTPIKLFDWSKDPPTTLRAGDLVKFKPISAEEYEKLKRHAELERKAVKVEGLPALEIEFAGPGVTVQDLGRTGYRKYGVPSSGALDLRSHIMANILVGNKINDACIEVFQSTFTAKALRNLVVAVTGAEVEVKVDNEAIPQWQAVPVREGSVISIEKFHRGQVAYIAISGGISEMEVMKSKSYYLRGGVGRKFNAGSIIHIKADKFNEVVKSCPARKLPEKFRVQISDVCELKTVIGPHEDWFTRETISTFLSEEFTVTPQIDRMGFRLAGPRLKHAKGGGRLISCGTLPGAVQVPPDGNPIVLMADAQTTGGYPIIGTVAKSELCKLAQSPPGSKVRFREASIDDARKLFLREAELINEALELIDKQAKLFSEKYTYLAVEYNKKFIDIWLREVSET